MKTPCLNCPNRKIGCHSRCTEYLKFQQHQVLLREQRLQEGILLGYQRSLKCRLKKRKHSRKE
nr:MAG TPA: hypothetical protein [Caudoviricetes sp.]